MLTVFAAPAFAGEFRVYSPEAYKQLNRLKGPSHMRIYGEAVELLVDYSGSMGGWIAVAKDALNFILPNIPKNSAVAVRIFGGIAYQETKFENSCQASMQIVPFGKGNQGVVKEGLDDTKIGGVTPIEFALRQTVEEDFNRVSVYDRNTTRKPKRIVLVTDGYENCGGDPCAYIRELMRTRKDIKIDVIQLGNNDKLACLADATGGNYYVVDGSREKFETAFETVFNVPRGTVASARNGEKSTYHKSTPAKKPNKKLANKYKFVKY